MEKPMKTIGARHFQIFFMFLSGMISFGMNTCVSVAVVEMTEKPSNSSNHQIETFTWESKIVDLILSSLIWGTVIGQIPFGLLVMRISAQKVITTCIFISGLTYLLIPVLASTVGWIGVIACTAISGLALASIEICQHSLLSRWAPPAERARLSSFVLSGANLGNAFAMMTAGILGGSSYGWPSIFYTFGGIATLWAIFFRFMGVNSPAEHSTISYEERSYIENSLDSHQKTENENLKFPWKAVLKSLPVWAFVFCVCGELWTFHLMMTQLPMFMKKALNFNIQKSGMISALPFVVKVLLAIPISWSSDFALKRGVPVSIVRKLANTLGMWGPAAALVSLCLTDPRSNETLTIFIFVLIVALNAGVMCGYLINALDLCPNFSGTLFSLVNTVGKIFGVCAPIAVGIVVPDQTNINQWRIIFYISAGMSFIPNLVFLIFGTAEKQPWNDPNYSKNSYAISPKNKSTKNSSSEDNI